MSPPTEQLIRDYLNRLSVAARDRLGPDDRRALVDRTRKLIERRADFAGRPSTLEVGKVLARLGDPAALVEQEWRRLAAVRGGRSADSPAPVMVPQPAEADDSWEPAEPAEPVSGRSLLGWARRRDWGRGWRGSSGWPTAVPGENGAPDAGVAAPATSSPKPGRPPVVEQDNGTATYPRSDLPVRAGSTVGAWIAPAIRGRKTAEDGPAAAPNGTNGINGHSAATSTAPFVTDTGDEFETPDSAAVSGGAVRLLARIGSAAWEQPLEATAIILLGVGGVIFPPVFVLGALVALGSKVWHYRDKWAGLVLPPLLTVIAAAAGIAVGGTHHGIHDAWVALNIVSRVAALLGAGYLAWRTGSGRRPPPAPPWHKPHRVTGS